MTAVQAEYVLLLLLLPCCAARDFFPAIVVNAPPAPRAPPRPASAATSALPPRAPPRFRLRRTRAGDLDDVAALLAAEAVPPPRPEEAAEAWGDRMARLRAQSEYRNQLAHRLAVVDAGRATVRRSRRGDDLRAPSADLGDDDDACRLLWSNHDFRTKLRRAVGSAQETSAWRSRDLDVPPAPDLLHHAMMSVEAPDSGEVVGFCEIAMLPSPATSRGGLERDRETPGPSILDVPESYCEETPDSYCGIYDDEAAHFSGDCFSAAPHAPAILNLVTSRSHRRMGVASRLLRGAARYARSQWRVRVDDGAAQKSSLGLYVRPDNVAARRLYYQHGFEPATTGDDGLLYMVQRR